MTATSPGRSAAGPLPLPLTAGPVAGQVINIVFAATIVLFLLGLFTIGPVA